jgi:H+/Cl- antiporter ClcA
MKKQTREEWMQDVQASQRNIVFPDTAANEARLWRNLIKGKLTFLQVIGIGLMFAMLATSIGSMIYWRLRVSQAQGSFFERLVQNFGAWIIALAICGGLFLLLRWRVHDALKATRKHN